VLLAAYQCGPGMGSVSQIGWEWYSRLSRRVPVLLVTHVRNREALSRAGAPLPGSDVLYIDTEWFAGPLYRLASKMFPKSQHSVFLISSADFFLYDRQALRLIRRHLHDGPGIDVVHAVTPVSPVAPTVLHRLRKPLILGPLNGGIQTPAEFSSIMRDDSPWLYRLRSAAAAADAVVGCYRGAAVILTATQATREAIPAQYRHKTRAMLENGVDLDRFHPSPWPDPPGTHSPLRVLFVGRLVPFKGVPLLLRAVARISGEFPVEVTIVGEGPMERDWKDVAQAEGIGPNVVFSGHRTLEEVAGFMRRAHVFCLPSVRESGGAVVLEALASARPVIAVAHGGPAELVDDGVGKAIPPNGPEAVVKDFAEALRDVANRPDEWRLKGEEGRRRAERDYSWDAKTEQALELYSDQMKRRAASA
jgi:glycosyltransferase involved in cell wall biosynthesis